MIAVTKLPVWEAVVNGVDVTLHVKYADDREVMIERIEHPTAIRAERRELSSLLWSELRCRAEGRRPLAELHARILAEAETLVRNHAGKTEQ